MRSRHDMPFGAQLFDGGTRFRLWAPGAHQVELCLETAGGPRRRPMARVEDGWHELDEPGVGAGTRYRFRIDGRLEVPDPAARFNPADVHGASEVVDPFAFHWDEGWRGRPWEEAVVYELHVGTYTPQGTHRAVEEHLDHLVQLGVTAIELMPLAEFPGGRNWGYDGVLPFAPDARYGTPDDLKRLVTAAHERGLMVFLDVVYNHFGPEGNYLHAYAGDFFTERHHTAWGAALNFDGERSRWVRAFFVHNALYWLEEYHFDGLRLDAVHAILDDSDRHILREIAAAVHERFGAERRVHLILENDENQASLLAPAPGSGDGSDGQWADDLHHCLHVLTTGETDGYYADFARDTRRLLGRALAEGFAYQGDPSSYRNGRPRGERSAGLRSTAFIAFLQNHDQVGNRALGERLGKLAAPEPLRAAVAILLLAPQVPLLFMGEEWNSSQPFLFFCDFEPELAAKVREGRGREFGAFSRFGDATARLLIPDPCAEETFARSRIDWQEAQREPHRTWLQLYQQLLALRGREVVPRLAGARGVGFSVDEREVLRVSWRMSDGAVLHLLTNLGDAEVPLVQPPPGRLLYRTHPQAAAALTGGGLAPWTVMWSLETPHG